jgi:hypothetical protein
MVVAAVTVPRSPPGSMLEVQVRCHTVVTVTVRSRVGVVNRWAHVERFGVVLGR